jgi:antitoxin (DNA-binding transcriptional repressor) of toxin-antitoxin stability system
MASVLHISEEEATRDFASVMRRVRAGDEVVLEDGGRPVAVLRPPAPDLGERSREVERIPGKTAAEIVEGLRRWEAAHGPLKLDEDFARDIDEARRWGNQPLDDSKWD